MTVDKQWEIVISEKRHGYTVGTKGSFRTRAEAEQALKNGTYTVGLDLKSLNVGVREKIDSEQIGAYKRYATGGLVDYTGPAWVDSTPNQPESFLNPQDTARIGAAAELLANLPIFNSTSSADNVASTNIGDTSIEIHINIDNISDDYDVDQMVERIKQDIVDVSKPIGTSVILNK